jgi:hypothetical protein
MKDRFADCWVLADRSDKADDNAEYFYRFVQSQPDAPKIFFLLDRNSPDWARLRDDGFNLIEFNSLEHLAAVVHARCVISSQATPVIRYPIALRYIRDLCSFDFVFLQHGIISADCSGWINQHTFRFFVCSTPEEYADLIDEKGPYNLTPRNTVLTGLARHDTLFRRKNDLEKNIIAVMPTWRAYLAWPDRNKTMSYIFDENIDESDYARNWLALLRSDAVKSICEERGLTIALMPHPIIRPFFAEKSFPSHVTVPSKDTSYQDIILRSALCITDYSSVANDMAAIGVPIIHFAFEEELMASGRHTSRMDMEKLEATGMGPVLKDTDQVITTMRQFLENPDARDKYTLRKERAFGCCDGRRAAGHTRC